MTAEIVAQNQDHAIIQWSGPTGFGQVTLNYDGKGGYHVDAEFVSLDTLLSILKALANEKEE